MNTITSKPKTQSGAVLIVSLIILLILTVIGVSAMSTSSLEEKMAGNLRDQSVSFQAAESTLSDSEQALNGWIAIPVATSAGNTSVWLRDSMGTISSLAYDDNWWQSKAFLANQTAQNLSTLPIDPRYVIEELKFTSDTLNPNDRAKGLGVFYYRDTARAHGMTKHSLTILQTTFARRFK